jgi:hypothetical protein
MFVCMNGVKQLKQLFTWKYITEGAQKIKISFHGHQWKVMGTSVRSLLADEWQHKFYSARKCTIQLVSASNGAGKYCRDNPWIRYIMRWNGISSRNRITIYFLRLIAFLRQISHAKKNSSSRLYTTHGLSPKQRDLRYSSKTSIFYRNDSVFHLESIRSQLQNVLLFELFNTRFSNWIIYNTFSYFLWIKDI